MYMIWHYLKYVQFHRMMFDNDSKTFFIINPYRFNSIYIFSSGASHRAPTIEPKIHFLSSVQTVTKYNPDWE